jgi:hypothetical protein
VGDAREHQPMPVNSRRILMAVGPMISPSGL